MDVVTFHFTDGSDASFSVAPEVAQEIDKDLHWKTSTCIYFTRFTDAGGDEQRINLAQIRWVSIERGVTA